MPLRVQARGPRPPRGAVALCAVLTLGCGAAAGALVVGQNRTTPVIVAARPLAAGAVIERADLKAADLAGSGLTAVKASQGGALLGKTVVGPIPAGTLINAAMVSTDPPPPTGQVTVGLALTPGQLPAGQLTAGRYVVIFELPAKGAAATPASPSGSSSGASGNANNSTSGGASAGAAARVLVDRAKVLNVTQSPSGGGTQVSVIVAQQVAPQVAVASFAGLVGVGLLPVGTG